MLTNRQSLSNRTSDNETDFCDFSYTDQSRILQLLEGLSPSITDGPLFKQLRKQYVNNLITTEQLIDQLTEMTETVDRVSRRSLQDTLKRVTDIVMFNV